jgi:predicted nucleic acid-binding protein
VNYWDSSAIIPLLIREPQTAHYSRLQDTDAMVTWWVAPVECCSAISRKLREGVLGSADFAAAMRLLGELRSTWVEIEPNDQIRQTAIRLLSHHHLRAADALHLSAALIASRFDPHSMRFLTEDEALKRIAEKEGFAVE